MKKVTLEQANLYIVICRNMQYFNSPFCSCGNKYLAKSAFVSEKDVPTLLNSLKELGFITISDMNGRRAIYLTNESSFDVGNFFKKKEAV